MSIRLRVLLGINFCWDFLDPEVNLDELLGVYTMLDYIYSCEFKKRLH